MQPYSRLSRLSNLPSKDVDPTARAIVPCALSASHVCTRRDVPNSSSSSRRRPKHGQTRQEDYVRTWLNQPSWSRARESSDNMPRNLLPSPGDSFKSFGSSSKRSEKPTASVNDANYRDSLRHRGIYIQPQCPPSELIQRAQNHIAPTRNA
jgi:hypothetical protein